MMMAKIKSEEKINVLRCQSERCRTLPQRSPTRSPPPTPAQANPCCGAARRSARCGDAREAKPGRDLLPVPAGGPDSQLIEVFMKSALPVCTSNHHSLAPTRAPSPSFVSHASTFAAHARPSCTSYAPTPVARPLLNLRAGGRARDGGSRLCGRGS